jgi:lipid II:glycine glycyltransferase (peptidoglycan interpeptide bridge formation enzyme)
MVLRSERVVSKVEWSRLLLGLPRPHLLQTWQWGELKEKYGWQAERIVWRDDGGRALAAAQVLARSLSGHLTILYCPRGPVLDWSDESVQQGVLADLRRLAADQRALFIKIDPDLAVGRGLPGEPSAVEDPTGAGLERNLAAAGWRPSPEQIQFRNTLILDLAVSEDSLLAAMKQKTRYNIRLAQRRGVRVRLGDDDDLDRLYRMYAETSVRDGFVIRHFEYYLDAWGAFLAAGMAQPFVAEVGDEAVAGLVVYRFGPTVWYLYGMSRQAHREDMPNHLLQWEAIRWARAQGCRTYDFWGAPDDLDPEDPMWGVYRFKEGFGAQLVRTLGAWDLPLRPIPYRLYQVVLPRFLEILRRRGRAQTRRLLE